MPEQSMTHAHDEQVLTLYDFENLRKGVLQKLMSNNENTIHSNRIIDTGWNRFQFDFTTTDEFFLKGVVCRVIRKKADLAQLELLLSQVQGLVDSGINDLKIIFGVELYLNKASILHQQSIKLLTSQYSFIEKTHFL